MKLHTKSSLRRILASFALSTALLLTSFVPAAGSFGYFTLEIADNTKSGDLSGIKIDVYDAVLDRVDRATGIQIYAHNYSHSVYTKANGTVTFAKPSNLFLVMVDLETLPAGVGIDRDQVFYSDASKKSATLSASEIDSFTISYDDAVENSVRVDIFNASGEQIKAVYTVTPDTISSARTSLLAKTSQISGSVTVGNTTKSYQYTVANTGDPIELVAEALEAGKISQEEALDFYLEIWDSRAFGSCGTVLATRLLSFYEDTAFFSQLTPEKQETLLEMVAPSKTRGDATYRGPSGTGDFAINFNDPNYSGLTLTAPQLIVDIYNNFVAVYGVFVHTGYITTFNKPVSAVGSSVYNVDVIIGNDAPYTGCSGDGTSYIKIFIPSLSISDPESLNWLKGVVAHEYMHAITNIYRYGLHGLPIWFADGIAAWAPYRLYGSLETGNTIQVNEFLEFNHYPLIAQNHYGAALFPLYMYIKGGDNTIKAILAYLSLGSPNYIYDVYQAINIVTSSGALSGGLKGTFADFWVDNYAPRITYSLYATNQWRSEPGSIVTYSSPSTTYMVSSFACYYIGFAFTPGSTKNITLNVWSGTVSDFRHFVVLKLSNGSLGKVDITSYIGSMVSVVIPAGNYTGGNIVSVNAGPGGMGCQIYIS
ncbi:MAG: hypothetical protein FWF18_04120 [Dehalococcoidia bacterium]|nr:hypothetical protein [Dehalococcoidia bacterium]